MNKALVTFALCLAPQAASAAPSGSTPSGSAAIGAAVPSAAADERPASQTLTGDFIEHHGWYVAPTFGATTVDDDAALMVGLRGAWLVNHTFGFGLTATGFTNDTSETASSSTIDGGYGGLLLQYYVLPSNLVHGFIETTFGGGAVCMGENARDDYDCSEDTFFMVEPTANLEVNIAKHVRFTVGGGYRIASTESGSELSGGDLSGPVVRSSFKFGEF